MRIGDALQAAIDRARRMLFEPFSFERWLLFGIIAFLDVFLAGGGASRFGSRFSTNTSGRGGSFDGQSLDRAAEWIGNHIGQIVLIGLPLFAIALAIHVALLYVGCRGQLMFVRSVSLNGGQIGDHWGAVKRPATSLFYFRLVLLGVQLAVTLVVLAFALIAIAILGGIQSGEALLFIALPLVAVFILVAICLGLIRLMLRSFVAPLMWAHDLTCLEAWGVFANIARENLMPLLGFVLVKIAYSIGFSIATVLVGCVTCCVGWLPVVHHTLFAPFYVFDRLFSMELLAMTGDEGRAVFPVREDTRFNEVPPLEG
jgi:hypothetical protein